MVMMAMMMTVVVVIMMELATKYFLQARYCSKLFPYIISFNPHTNPMKYLLFVTHFIDEKTKGQRVN